MILTEKNVLKNVKEGRRKYGVFIFKSERLGLVRVKAHNILVDRLFSKKPENLVPSIRVSIIHSDFKCEFAKIILEDLKPYAILGYDEWQNSKILQILWIKDNSVTFTTYMERKWLSSF